MYNNSYPTRRNKEKEKPDKEIIQYGMAVGKEIQYMVWDPGPI